VWFLWDGEAILVFSEPTSFRVRNIKNNPHVALTLQGVDGLGNNVVIINGEAELRPGNRAIPDAYWQKYDMNAAIAGGMKAAGQSYSGKYGFIETYMVWPIHHMVVAKDHSLKCGDCHSERGRLDWKALGYKGDPRDPKNR
jgi:hypothetical protein